MKTIMSLYEPYADNFFLEIYTKFIDDSGDHIDLFSELDRNHEKMVIDDGKLCQVIFIFVSNAHATSRAHELEFLVLFTTSAQFQKILDK